MPDAIITSTASTFGTITGTFQADQSTITGTITGIVVGTLTGSVGVPGPQGEQGPAGPVGPAGPAGPGVAAGGLEGQILLKASDTSYDTVWADNFANAVKATVRNESGSTMSKGTVVYISGASGNKAVVSKASASTEAGSSKTFAILEEDIPTNQNGTAITMGLLKGIDTSAFSPGANLWLSTNPGQIVSPTPPASPAHAVFLGNAVRIHANQGEIEVRIANGYELGELHDVLLDTPANGQVLKYDAFQGLWINANDNNNGVWGQISGVISNQLDLQSALDGKYSTTNPAGYQTAGQVTSALAPYLLSSTASATYLTQANAASTYYPASNPSSFITASALTPYLTISGASATYQTLSGMSAYLTTSSAAATYYPISNPANYITSAALTGYATESWVTAGFYPLASNPAGYLTAVPAGYATESWVIGQGYLTASALTPYLTSATAAATYQTIAGMSSYLTTSAAASTYQTIAGMAGYATESWVNSQGFLTASSLTGYATESWVTSQGYLTDAPSDGNQYARKNGAWDVVSTPPDYITSVSSPLSVTSGDLSVDLSAYLTTATAASTYQTQAAMSGYLTVANASATYAPLASPALTGNPTAPTPATSDNDTSIATTAFVKAQGYLTSASLTGYATESFVTSQGYITASALTPYAPLAGATFTGKVNTVASTTGSAGLNIPHGTAPTAPVNGDIWTTTGNLQVRINGGTQSIPALGSNNTFSNSSGTFSNGTATGTVNLASGATISGSTKTVNIGTGGVAGSTTNIAIGATAGTSTTTLQGSTNGVTLAADTNTTGLATTAFVVGQAGSATPLVDGTAAVGTSLRYARQDHVHPTDTTRAPLASPAFTGTPTAPTAAVDTNTTQLATTAYVVGQGYLKSATASSTYAPLASPALTGTPTAPTATAGTNTTQIATTAFVTAAVPAFGSVSDIKEPLSTTKAASIENVREMLLSPAFQHFYYGNGINGTSGTGSAVNNNGGRWKEYVSPNSGIAGYAKGVFDTNSSGIGFAGYTRGVNLTTRNWSKKVWMSGRCMIGHFSLSTYNGSANTFARVSLGGYTAFGAGDMSSTIKGIGWRLQGGGASALELQVCNGSTVTTVTSSFTPVLKEVFDWEIYSDGAGNVTLFVNDSQVATTTSGPTGTQASGLYMEGVDTTASSTAAFILNNLGTKIYFGI